MFLFSEFFLITLYHKYCNHALCLQTYSVVQTYENTLFCSCWAAKLNSKCYMKSMVFQLCNRNTKWYLCNTVIFCNHFAGQQRKKLWKAELCSSAVLMRMQLPLLTTESCLIWLQAVRGQKILRRCFLNCLFLPLFVCLFICFCICIVMWQSFWGHLPVYQRRWSKAPLSLHQQGTQLWSREGKLSDYT